MTQLTFRRAESWGSNIEFSVADLPALVGTPKQIAWATKTRAKAVDELRYYGSNLIDKAQTAKLDADKIDVGLASVSERFSLNLDNLTSAAWWIEEVHNGRYEGICGATTPGGWPALGRILNRKPAA